MFIGMAIAMDEMEMDEVDIEKKWVIIFINNKNVGKCRLLTLAPFHQKERNPELRCSLKLSFAW